MKSNLYFGMCHAPALVTMTGEGERLDGFDLRGILDSIGTTAAQVTGLISTVKEKPAPIVTIQQTPAADYQKYLLPIGVGAGVLVLIMLLKR